MEQNFDDSVNAQKWQTLILPVEVIRKILQFGTMIYISLQMMAFMGKNYGNMMDKCSKWFINPGPDSSNPQYFTPFNGNYLIFSADDGTHGYELWAVDDADYTYLWRDLRTGSTSSYPTDLAATNGAYLYFSALGNHGVYGKELYMCPDVGSM